MPTAALHSDDDGTFVYLVEDGKRVRTPIEIGEAYGAQTEVLSGVAEGDVIEVLTITGRRGAGGGRGGDGGQGDIRFPGGGNVQAPGGGTFQPPAGLTFGNAG